MHVYHFDRDLDNYETPVRPETCVQLPELPAEGRETELEPTSMHLIERLSPHLSSLKALLLPSPQFSSEVSLLILLLLFLLYLILFPPPSSSPLPTPLLTPSPSSFLSSSASSSHPYCGAV
ncbi:hypothetical protein SprV_0301037100 [Sparganum proliferum]